MAENSAIQWTDHTFNPWWGCERVSPGCAHCYADHVAKRYVPDQQLWGAGHVFRLFGDKHWAEPLRWDAQAEREGVRRRVFCASMADVFEDRPELEPHRVRLFNLIDETLSLDWQLLTKRPAIARDWLRRWYGLDGSVDAEVTEGPNANVWLGTSVENAHWRTRIDELRAAPAAVRFLSCEPLLGPLVCPVCKGNGWVPGETLGCCGDVLASGECCAAVYGQSRLIAEATQEQCPGPDGRGCIGDLNLERIDWVIVGGESGLRARPMDEQWIRDIIAACQRQGAAPFVKQLGTDWAVRHGHGRTHAGDPEQWPEDLRIREFPRQAVPA